MREIKVRVWNPTLNKMVYDAEEINVNGNDAVLNVSNGKLVAEYRTEEGYWANAEILENTGLKDKNGVEIFEGDIIQYTGNINNGYRDLEVTRKAEVTFSLGMFWGGYGGNLAQVRKKAEVIGNIYNNPNLLEGDTHA